MAWAVGGRGLAGHDEIGAPAHLVAGLHLHGEDLELRYLGGGHSGNVNHRIVGVQKK